MDRVGCIGSCNVFVGDADDLENEDNGIQRNGIGFVLNLSGYTVDSSVMNAASYVHIPLRDGENRVQDFVLVIRVLQDRVVNTDDSILVACSMGMSRSVVAAATLLADCQGVGLDDALSQVKMARGIDQNPHPALVEYGRSFLRAVRGENRS